MDKVKVEQDTAGAPVYRVTAKLHTKIRPTIAKEALPLLTVIVEDKNMIFTYHGGILNSRTAPSVVGPEQFYEWYCDGRLHRDDGPARRTASGQLSWYRDGQRLQYRY